MIDFDHCLNTAKSAALLAGKFLLQSRGQDIKVLLNKGRDIKLQIDLDTENIIKEFLSSHSSFSILGEETGLSGELDEFYWVVDPLDGTSNFFRDIPICCVSIALMHHAKPVLGVVYDFNHEDLYFGHQESKAYLNNQEIHVSSLSQKSESTLVTGIPAKTNYTDKEFSKMREGPDSRETRGGRKKAKGLTEFDLTEMTEGMKMRESVRQRNSIETAEGEFM